MYVIMYVFAVYNFFMYRYFLFIFLFLSSHVWAEWVFVGKNTDGDYFIDPSTIRKDGVLRTFWSMANYVKPDPDGTNSIRVKRENNCQQETITGLYITTFSKPMLSGEVLVNGAPTPKVVPIAPNTVDTEYEKFVCDRK